MSLDQTTSYHLHVACGCAVQPWVHHRSCSVKASLIYIPQALRQSAMKTEGYSSGINSNSTPSATPLSTAKPLPNDRPDKPASSGSSSKVKTEVKTEIKTERVSQGSAATPSKSVKVKSEKTVKVKTEKKSERPNGTDVPVVRFSGSALLSGLRCPVSRFLAAPPLFDQAATPTQLLDARPPFFFLRPSASQLPLRPWKLSVQLSLLPPK